MCKVKSVHSVSRMMSDGQVGRLRRACLNLYTVTGKCVQAAQKELDSEQMWNIIIFTQGYGRLTAGQKKLPAPTGHAQSAASRRPTRSLQGQRVFRRRRFAAGQIRNAPVGRGRQSANQSGG